MRSLRVIGRASVLLAALAGCGGSDGPTEPVSDINSISFTYSGAISGSFGVSAPAEPGPDRATALRLSGPPRMLAIAGFKMHTATRAAVIQLFLPDVSAPRSFSLRDDACLDFYAACPLAAFAPDMQGQPSLSPDAELEEFYFFSSGTVVITSVSATRVAGTFEGTAETLTLGEPSKTITISNGKFDMAIASLEGF